MTGGTVTARRARAARALRAVAKWQVDSTKGVPPKPDLYSLHTRVSA